MNNPNFGKKSKNQQRMMLDMMASRGGFHHGGMMGYGGMGMQFMGHDEDSFMSTGAMIHNKFKDSLQMMSPPFPDDMDDDYDDKII